MYLAVLGGLKQWGKLEAAGLPGDVAIAGYDTATLSAIGARALVVLPIVFLVLLVLVRAIGDESEAERSAFARAWDRLPGLIVQVLVLSAGVLVGLSVAATLASLPVAPGASHLLKVAGVNLLFMAFYALIPVSFLLIRALWRRRPDRGEGAGNGGPSPDARSAQPDSSEPTPDPTVQQPLAEPRLLAWSRRRTAAMAGRKATSIAVAALMVDVTVGAGMMAVAAHRDGYDAALAWFVGAAIVISLPYVLLILRLAAAIWRTTALAEEAGTFDETTILLLFVIAVAFLLPLWVAAFVVPVLLLTFLCGQAPLAPQIDQSRTPWWPASLIARALLVSLVVSTGAISVSTQQPQRFSRATFPVGPGLTADAALLGQADGHLLLGVCDRRKDGTSDAVELLRIPKARVPAYRIVDDGYVFYRDREPTLLSGFLDRFGLAYRPPTLRPPSKAPPANVCGSKPKLPSWIFERLRLYEPRKVS